MTKEEKQKIYDIIATLDAKIGIGIKKKKGYSSRQVANILKVEHYFIFKAKRYGRVRNNIDLISIFKGTYCKLSKKYFVRRFLEKGYSNLWIKHNLGEDYYKSIFTKKSDMERKRKEKLQQNILSIYREGQGRNMRKLTLEIIIKTLKSAPSKDFGLRKLRQYALTRSIKERLKKYGLNIQDVMEKDIKELKEIVVKTYIRKRIEIRNFEEFMLAIYEQQIPLTELDKFSIKKSFRGFVRDWLRYRLLSRKALDKMIAESTSFEDFKEKFVEKIFGYVDTRYFTQNGIKHEQKRERIKINKNLKKDIYDKETFLKIAKKEGYMMAVKRLANKSIYDFYRKKYGSMKNFKKLLREGKL